MGFPIYIGTGMIKAQDKQDNDSFFEDTKQINGKGRGG
jgi:hypothetical protein